MTERRQEKAGPLSPMVLAESWLTRVALRAALARQRSRLGSVVQAPADPTRGTTVNDETNGRSEHGK